MLSLFPGRIPVPVLFSNGQSKQCDMAMGGCSHYLCAITFLWTCQAQKYSFSPLFFRSVDIKQIIMLLKLLERWRANHSSFIYGWGWGVFSLNYTLVISVWRKACQRHKVVFQSDRLYIDLPWLQLSQALFHNLSTCHTQKKTLYITQCTWSFWELHWEHTFLRLKIPSPDWN